MISSVIEDRKVNPKEGSYVNSLLEGSIDRILKKIGDIDIFIIQCRCALILILKANISKEII